MTRESNPGAVRFGVFEVDLHTAELYKSGRKVRIEAQPFKLLSVLLEQPGQLVSRRELREKLWAPDVYVDFDHSLNVYIQRLRLVLGDSAENPRFIETLPRHGYRFIYPVQGQQSEPDPDHLAGRVWAVLLLLVVAAALAAVWRVRGRANDAPNLMVPQPLTSYPGRESFPTFSPDGSLLGFCWNGESQNNWDIYVRQLGTDSVRRLTADPAKELCPVFSPDGSHIVFLRETGISRAAVVRIPVNGGPEQPLTELILPEGDLYTRPGPYLAWTPDGRSLVVVDRESSSQQAALFLFSVETMRKRRLTTPPPGDSDDDGPAVSPDGRWLAFSRGAEVSELLLLGLSSEGKPAGEPKQITHERQHANSPAWAPDGRELVFSMGPYQDHSLWRMALVNGTPGPPISLAYAGEANWHPAISPRGDMLVFTHQLGGGSEIWRTATSGGASPAALPEKLIFSTRDEEEPEYSPDGKYIAFKSNRLGQLEIWRCRADGTEPVQLTHRVGENTFMPRWSPDGRKILFTSNPDGNHDLFLVDSEGGTPVRLISGKHNEVAGAFSRSGRWIYFHSDRTGRKEVWKASFTVDGTCGPEVQVTENGGISPEESQDGKFLYFLKEGTPRSLWRMPAGGGPETQVLPSVHDDNFTVVDDGICFIQGMGPNRYSVRFLNLASGKISDLLEPLEPGWGLTVSPMPGGRGRSILFVQCRPDDSDLMIVEGFR